MRTLFITVSLLPGMFAVQDAPPAEQAVSKISAQICPADSELQWLKIPWRVSFWQGVKDSQTQGKPILLWAMNGHPLGCT